ncbi:cytochrome b [Cupriavidus taiwanensis]|uniref:cytochrome b n=1 Tax=Cupriavidus taiwanensis TaxID=164546 RepID=UPI000E100E9F|nr:cytochrome b [Cupriavidus taiwanensis]SOY56179.1 putative Cytochrome B561 [Cupriavidus taiwanensis]SOY56751.1 putative Cytochrome B561 [Cupriavidus taiwanensis]SOY90656.1 putative Cytochrome B561 [Cupriavidus taiwanensis]SOZ63433.1 putative Cytochrome B561 [Cupriavidus taiwanensis]SOZ82430.1 putative Cytochrome B561 [Cupriavidus taiwanensis]
MHPVTEIRPLPQTLPSSRRYDRLAVSFHWIVFVLVALTYAAIELKGSFARGTPPRALAMAVHEWAGALVLVLAVPRLLWRLLRGAPAPEPGARWMQLAGAAMHWVLYLFILAQPLLGLLAMNAGGHLLSLPALGIEVPALVAPAPALKDSVKDIHETLGTAFYLVIGLHAMASLFHHYMLGDDTLRRMWR